MNVLPTAHRAAPEAAAPLGAPLRAHDIGRAATLALYDELALSPKPGLVTLTCRGSHHDMDAHTFMRSLFALRSYFVRIAELGAANAPFEALEQCGQAAEVRMRAATRGVNTHRGAVFMLGLLCAAAGSLGRRSSPDAIRHALITRWGPALQARAQRSATLPGGIAAQRLGLRGASREAALGFPTLFETAVPALAHATARGLDPTAARVDTLWALVASLDDCNLAHRGGLDGLRWAQTQARAFLAQGGMGAPGGLRRAAALGESFVQRRLSPGGAADTLAAACLLQRIA